MSCNVRENYKEKKEIFSPTIWQIFFTIHGLEVFKRAALRVIIFFLQCGLSRSL